MVKGPAHNRASKYAQAIAEEFPHRLKSADDAPDAALLYRRVLAAVIEDLMLSPTAAAGP